MIHQVCFTSGQVWMSVEEKTRLRRQYENEAFKDGKLENAYGTGESRQLEMNSSGSLVWHTVQLEQPLPEEHTTPQIVASTVNIKEEGETRATTVCFEICFPIIYFLVLSAIPIATIVVGAISKYTCQKDPHVPALLISLGVILNVHVVLSVYAYLIANGNIPKVLTGNGVLIDKVVAVAVIILDLTSLPLLIALSVKVFGSHTIDRDCNQPLHDCTFAVIIASWLAAVVHTILVITGFIQQRALKQREFDNGSSETAEAT